MFKSLALGIAVSVLSISSAGAADINTGTNGDFIEPPLDSVASSSIWSGVYTGLYGGLDWKTVGVMGANDIDLNQQKEVGAYVGINQALGDAIVGGLEWMAGFSGKEETEAGITAKQDWETSLRARMGYAFEQNMIYGLAGVSASQLELSDATGSDTRWLAGWTVGAGIERQLTDQIIGRVEYDYTDYGERKFGLGAGSTDADLSGHGLKLGLGVKF